MNLSVAERIADAVLYEGYVLYPYRASAAKNRLRWQVGLVAPRDHVEAAGSDVWWMQTECLAEAPAHAAVTIRVRALQVQERAVETLLAGAGWQAVESLAIGGRQVVTWDEAVVREFVVAGWPVHGEARAEWHDWKIQGSEEIELLDGAEAGVTARIVRRKQAIDARLQISREPCGELTRIRVRVENVSACPPGMPRDAAVRRSLAGTHTLLHLEGGSFISLLEPPEEFAALATACRNEHTWPVLVGDDRRRDVMLSSPIILYDYPAIAPESPGDLCDATEIDEMLMLRVQTLTDAEKQDARLTDRRAAEIIDRAESASPATMSGLHGAIRHQADVPVSGMPAWETFLNPPDAPVPEAATLEIGTVVIGRGSRVRLQPTRLSDSMDIVLKGRLATVTAVYRTLEDAPYVAVSLDDDPMGAAGAPYRRSLFFHPDELVPIGPGRETAR